MTTFFHHRVMKPTLYLILWLLLASSVLTPAHAGNGISLIRDAEIESYLRDLSLPIFEAAGLDTNSVQIYIVESDVLNAFVAGGQNVFFHTALIQASSTPDMIRGVMAHEVGHIIAGHLIGKRDAAEKAMLSSAVGYILGIASVAAGAPPEAAGAFIGGSQHIATQGFLKHSRQYEQEADQSALTILKEINESPQGLLELLDLLETRSRLLPYDINPYRSTHPVTTDRVEHIRAFLERYPELSQQQKQSMQKRHALVVAKLDGFLGDAEKIVSEAKQDTIADRYRLSIAYHKRSRTDEAIALLDGLIAEQPDNPYFHELKGQIYYESGAIEAALAPYRRAIQLAPEEALFQVGLALAHLQRNAPGDNEAARSLFRQALVREPKSAFYWRQLGIAEGRLGNLGRSYLALAEAALLQNDAKEASRYVVLAQEKLEDQGDMEAKIEDIKRQISSLKERR